MLDEYKTTVSGDSLDGEENEKNNINIKKIAIGNHSRIAIYYLVEVSF